jgi:heat shock protein HtpX
VLSGTHARPIAAGEQLQLRNVVEEMALAAGLPAPRLALMDVPDMNAYATGTSPRNATLVVTRGLAEGLDRAELQGVVAHELAHIANYDTRYMTVVSATVGLIVMVGDALARPFVRAEISQEKRLAAQIALIVLAFVGIVLSALISTAAKAVQLAVSFQREYLADATSVQFTRNPEGLISALVKLAAAARPFPGASHATQHLFIVSPLYHDADPTPPLLATHPTVADRIVRLRNLGA